MYKIIALDMDGTLLNSQKQISPVTKAAISKARAHGIRVVLASGRPLAGIRAKLAELDITSDQDYVLHFNGSVVENVATGEVIYREILSGKAAKQIAKVAKELNVNTHAFSQEYGLISPQVSKYTEVEAEINGIDINVMEFDTLADDHPIIKAMIVAEPAKLTQAIAQLPKELYQQYTIVQSAPYFLEFLNTKSNKGAGLKMIADHLGIPATQVMCMGDVENDHHMIEYAGLGIAMANGMEETKKLADFITLSNDEDGVAYAIEKFCFGQ
jgi:Cof subfamily protein (haloacid dehalogenase superfamily)